ncbi:MAG TPA: hypothetical protein VLI40_07685, partial [Gemmatimonadaceae bacterium]|nr:hypothetical protein [Gemmatimonadaceae bacterium]
HVANRRDRAARSRGGRAVSGRRDEVGEFVGADERFVIPTNAGSGVVIPAKAGIHVIDLWMR